MQHGLEEVKILFGESKVLTAVPVVGMGPIMSMARTDIGICLKLPISCHRVLNERTLLSSCGAMLIQCGNEVIAPPMLHDNEVSVVSSIPPLIPSLSPTLFLPSFPPPPLVHLLLLLLFLLLLFLLPFFLLLPLPRINIDGLLVSFLYDYILPRAVCIHSGSQVNPGCQGFFLVLCNCNS